MQRRCRNIFHRDVSKDVSTKLRHRDTSRDDCRTPFLRDTSIDGRDVSRDDFRLPFLRYTSKDDCRNMLCRDVSRDGCRILVHKDTGSNNSRCTTIEMPSYRWYEISLCIYTVRDRCRHKIVITALCRYVRNKPCRNVPVSVIPLCFTDMLVALFGPTGYSILYP